MIPYFDAHCDTALPVWAAGGSLRENGFHLDLSRLAAWAPCAQVFAVCVDHSDDMTGATDAVVANLLRQLDEYVARVRLCRSAADISAAAAEGKIAALISIEGAERLDCSVEKLRTLHARGVRIVHLTWNDDNILCGAALGSGAGLTEQGRAFLREAQRMGVAIDLSHCSERGFWDALECAEKPMLAGHSNARALCDHPRNLTDAQFRALTASGGVAGLNFCTDFLGGGRDVERIVDHAAHWLSLGGEKAVCLGTDFDGIPELPRGIAGVQSMETLYNAMLRRNWSEDTVRDIFQNNLNNFFAKVI